MGVDPFEVEKSRAEEEVRRGTVDRDRTRLCDCSHFPIRQMDRVTQKCLFPQETVPRVDVGVIFRLWIERHCQLDLGVVLRQMRLDV